MSPLSCGKSGEYIYTLRNMCNGWKENCSPLGKGKKVHVVQGSTLEKSSCSKGKVQNKLMNKNIILHSTSIYHHKPTISEFGGPFTPSHKFSLYFVTYDKFDPPRWGRAGQNYANLISYIVKEVVKLPLNPSCHLSHHPSIDGII